MGNGLTSCCVFSVVFLSVSRGSGLGDFEPAGHFLCIDGDCVCCNDSAGLCDDACYRF